MRRENLWSIILAGGEGERIRPLIERWQGRHRPKQYCTFVGSRSLFQHTLDRADMLAAAGQKIIVAARSHREEVREQLNGRGFGKLLFQPVNRGTAAGIFLPLAYVLARRPDATVVIYPSDHFVHPESRFVGFVQSAVDAISTVPDRMILLGIPPDGPEVEYGWILPGREIGSTGQPIREILLFVEKPDRATAEWAAARGALWNTFVLVTRAGLLWRLGGECFPELMPFFELMMERFDTAEEESTLQEIYRLMPTLNFSEGFLTRFTDRAAVLSIWDVMWSDWGKGERIAATLQKIGKRPSFPERLLAAS